MRGVSALFKRVGEMRQAAPWPVIHSPAYRSKRLSLAMRPALPDFAARCGARVRSLNLTHNDSRRKANCSYLLKAVTERHWPGGRSQKSPSGDTREALLPSECPTIFCNAHCRGPVVYQGRGRGGGWIMAAKLPSAAAGQSVSCFIGAMEGAGKL